MINVTKTYLPEFAEYIKVLKRAWETAWITNNGILVQELEQKLHEYLGVQHLLFASNGTIVLQMALKAMDLTREIITTPFSYVATTNAILWENCTPVFVDIDPQTFCIDAEKIEASITENTQAILATHVYGLPCNVEKIKAVADKYGLKVIYDGAHAFGVEYKGKQLLNYGDISTCSFHATKLFHTVEGGCIISQDEEVYKRLLLYRSFGHIGDEYFTKGINGKNSEFHAAMGLVNLPHIGEIINRRKQIHYKYIELLADCNTRFLSFDEKNVKYNFAYFPVLFSKETKLLKIKKALEQNDINSRRYFYPSLNTLPFLKKKYSCPVSEDIASRVLCLPMYPQLEENELVRITSVIKKEMKR